MPIVIRLAYRRRTPDDPLRRPECGWYEGMSEEDAWTAARGTWRFDLKRRGHERYAFVVGGHTGDGPVLAAVELDPTAGERASDGSGTSASSAGTSSSCRRPIRCAATPPTRRASARGTRCCTSTSPRRRGGPSRARAPAAAGPRSPATSPSATTGVPSRTGSTGTSAARHWRSWTGSTSTARPRATTSGTDRPATTDNTTRREPVTRPGAGLRRLYGPLRARFPSL